MDVKAVRRLSRMMRKSGTGQLLDVDRKRANRARTAPLKSSFAADKPRELLSQTGDHWEGVVELLFGLTQ